MSPDPPVETVAALSNAVETVTALSTEQADDVRRLASAAAATDGAEPLNEAALLRLRHERPDIVHLLVLLDRTLAGYAQLENAPDASVGQLVVDPRYRRRGIGGSSSPRCWPEPITRCRSGRWATPPPLTRSPHRPAWWPDANC